MVKTRILACKQQLAQTVSLGPVTEKQQREFEQLVEENKRLREDVEKWRAYAARLQSPDESNRRGIAGHATGSTFGFRPVGVNWHLTVEFSQTGAYIGRAGTSRADTHRQSRGNTRSDCSEVRRESGGANGG